MKPGHKPRYPRPQSLVLAIRVITTGVPSDDPPVCTWRMSFSGTPNLRMSATTNGLPWIVDIYTGHYYRVTIGNGVGEVWRSLPALIGHLRKFLGVGPTSTPQDEE